MTTERDLIRKFRNEDNYARYYVCHAPFRVGMGAWSWGVKPKTIFKIDEKRLLVDL